MDKLLRRSDVEDLVALKVAGRAVRWRASDISTWIEQQVAA